MKKLYIFLLAILIASCQSERKTKYNEGIYCLKNYLDKDNFESNYIENFIINVTKDKIIIFGTVNTWGNISDRNFEKEKLSMINDSTITVSTFTGAEKNIPKKNEFIQLKNAENIIDEKGINRKEFIKYLNKNLIAGVYKIGNKRIKFTEDGEIQNLDSLKTFAVNPRFGTNWWYDYRTIEINNQLWKFEFTKNNLILTKYLPREASNEENAKLSELKIVLTR